MTSRRQCAANRRNAAKSSGPRSQAGKAIARLNARLHGLAAPARAEPGADQEIERLARAIVEEAGQAELLQFARNIAEAEIDLRRIRRARAVAEKIPAPPPRTPAEPGSNPDAPRPVHVPVKQPPRDRGGAAFERYERRALSRRKSAIRAFDAARRLFPQAAGDA